MNLLLDTHVFLWYIADDPRLPDPWGAAIEEPGNVVFVSIVSLWEITVKSSLGKLIVALPLDTFISKNVAGNGFALLPIAPRHLATLHGLPFHHRDPFDRLLLAQCLADNLVFVTSDSEAAKYPVPRL